MDFVSSLGLHSHIEYFGTAVSMGGGVGTATALLKVKALTLATYHRISVVGVNTKDLVILE